MAFVRFEIWMILETKLIKRRSYLKLVILSFWILVETWGSKGSKMENNQSRIKDKRIIIQNINEEAIKLFSIPGRTSEHISSYYSASLLFDA